MAFENREENILWQTHRWELPHRLTAARYLLDNLFLSEPYDEGTSILVCCVCPRGVEDFFYDEIFDARKAIRLDPYEELIRRTYVDALLANGEVDEALAFWEPVVDREYWFPENHDVYARILLRRGSRKGGGPYLERAAEERLLVADPALRRRLENLAAILAED